MLTETQEIADFFEEAVRDARKVDTSITPKHIANWMINKKSEISSLVSAKLIERIVEAGKKSTMSDNDLLRVVGTVLEANEKAVADYKKGKEQSLMFLVGQIMRNLHGNGDAGHIKEVLVRTLK
jgi:aspartyl-tRNA(Asn)/glutamyl-tRNA(Gln) amidotransferase subunit B